MNLKNAALCSAILENIIFANAQKMFMALKNLIWRFTADPFFSIIVVERTIAVVAR